MANISDKKIIKSVKAFEGLYPDEWLLVRVIEDDPLSNPLRGILIGHSKSKEEIIEKSKKLKGDIALFFTGDIPKKGYAFCF